MAGLLGIDLNAEMQQLSQKIFDDQFFADKKMARELSDVAKQRMFDDVLININFVNTALALRDEKLFAEYARWCYCLVASRMTYCAKERVAEQMQGHYQSMKGTLSSIYSAADRDFICRQLDKAIEVTGAFYETDIAYEDPRDTRYETSVREYLARMLAGDVSGAMNLLAALENDGMPIPEICVGVVQEAMHRVGNLWLQNKITVDVEHCCTAISQMAQSQFYAKIFAGARRKETIVVACMGRELHEMGARMVSDVLSFGGYNCVYLGAAVPEENILHAIENYKPALLCLSVTMPQSLVPCGTLVSRLHTQQPQLRIAVGGRAFTLTENLWDKWNVDVYTKNALELLEWCYANLS